MRFNKKAGTIALLLLVCVPAPSTASGNLISQEPSRQKPASKGITPQQSRPSNKEYASIETTTNIRTRYEYFEDQFGAQQKADDIIATRISSRLTFRKGPLALDAELVDSRIFRASTFTPLGTDDINTTEPIQLSMSWKGQLNDRDRSGELLLKAGRFTMDIGSRRFIARNRFRNTLNTFDGLKVDYHKEGLSTTFFYTFPVSRLPERYTEKSTSEFELDKSSSDQRFYGVFSEIETTRGNLAFYALRDDTTQTDTQVHTQRNTFGHLAQLSLMKNIALDYEIAFQRGNRGFQAIKAGFIHTAVTTSLNNLTMQLFYDKATGDDVTTDNYEGFSTLYGARRFEFGPTGIFGVFARDNMSSPGISTTIAFSKDTELQLKYRQFNIHKSGDSGRLNGTVLENSAFLGSLSELRMRVKLSDNIGIEAGFARSRLNSVLALGNSINNYGYLQSSYFFQSVFD